MRYNIGNTQNEYIKYINCARAIKISLFFLPISRCRFLRDVGVLSNNLFPGVVQFPVWPVEGAAAPLPVNQPVHEHNNNSVLWLIA